MVPSEEKQHDAGQFNAWLRNLGPAKGPGRAAPPSQGQSADGSPVRPAGAIPQHAKLTQGGILGEIDQEVDDIFGRIVSDGPAAPAPMAARPAPAPVEPPPRTEAPKPPEVRRPVEAPAPVEAIALRPQPVPVREVTTAAAHPVQEILTPSAPAAPKSVFGRPITPAPVARAEIPTPEARPLPPRPQAPAAPTSMAPEQNITAQIEKAVSETRNMFQGQIKDLQAKYQEQRTKWEKVLTDLRLRNDELLKRNQELEQQIAELNDRHHAMIQEYAELRNQLDAQGLQPQPAVAAPVPDIAPSIEVAAERIDIGFSGLEESIGTGPAVRPAPDKRPELRPEISIDIPVTPAAEPAAASAIAEASGENLPESGAKEADDLLAELEALEKEMKNIGEGN